MRTFGFFTIKICFDTQFEKHSTGLFKHIKGKYDNQIND